MRFSSTRDGKHQLLPTPPAATIIDCCLDAMCAPVCVYVCVCELTKRFIISFGKLSHGASIIYHICNECKCHHTHTLEHAQQMDMHSHAQQAPRTHSKQIPMVVFEAFYVVLYRVALSYIYIFALGCVCAWKNMTTHISNIISEFTHRTEEVSARPHSYRAR